MGALPTPAWIATEDHDTRAQIRTPERCIRVDEDVGVWRASDAHDALILHVVRMAEACVGASTRRVAREAVRADAPDAIYRVLHLLHTVDAWTDAIAPQAHAQRFGNLAFRTWGERLTERLGALHDVLLPPHLRAFAPELCAYLGESFGSFVRIDYGTGHELNFVAWLAYLHRLGLFADVRNAEAVRVAEQRLALEVFPAYLAVAWHLQDRYSLEPAGSHGVWGLDDYHFVPYILGAAQLRSAEAFAPQSAAHLALYPFIRHGPRAGPRLSVDDTLFYVPPKAPGSLDAPLPNLYLASLARVHSLKRGPFSEHSPLLSDIAANVPSWHKVYTGLLKMYDAECLLKRPVVQHFVFGGVGYVWPSRAAEPRRGAAVAKPPPGGASRAAPGHLGTGRPPPAPAPHARVLGRMGRGGPPADPERFS